jgi:hypothetical protein
MCLDDFFQLAELPLAADVGPATIIMVHHGDV